jgi:hypothetical protein
LSIVNETSTPTPQHPIPPFPHPPWPPEEKKWNLHGAFSLCHSFSIPFTLSWRNNSPGTIGSLNENRVTNIYRHYLQYTTDTLPGSSGSPVFNDDWEVVALHHGGGHLKTNDKGDIRFVNQAVAMKYLLAGSDT